MKVYVINLKRDIDRMRYIGEKLESLGLSYERIEGVDGSVLDNEELSKIYSEDESIKLNGHPLSLGHVGCSASHLKVMETMIRDNIEVALVLEDDAGIEEGIIDVINANWVDKDNWEYLNIGYPILNHVWIRDWIRVNFKRIKGNVFFIFVFLIKLPYIIFLLIFESLRRSIYSILKINGPVKMFRPVYHANTYLVKLEGAKKIVSIGYPIRMVADRLPNQARVKNELKFRCLCLPASKKTGKFKSNTTNV